MSKSKYVCDLYKRSFSVIYKSEFKITDMGQVKSYCNINRPPDSIKSSFDSIIIQFYKGIDPYPHLPNIEGFRIVYSIIKEEKEMSLVDYEDAMSTGIQYKAFFLSRIQRISELL